MFGLGEAGALIAGDLVAAGAEVSAFDPADVATPEGVERFVHPSLAVHGADLVLGVTGGADAGLALLQSLEAVAGDAAYADLSTASPELKTRLAEYAAGRDLPFADVALMSMVPGNGLATPSLVAGTAARQYCAVINRLGGRAETINGPPGAASAKKLLRSVMTKGTAAVLIEAVRAGAAADDLEWLWDNLCREVSGAEEDWVRRLVAGSKTHAKRRKDEMEAALAMLDALETPSVMTRATIESLTELLEGDLPELPPFAPSDLAPEPPQTAEPEPMATEPADGQPTDLELTDPELPDPELPDLELPDLELPDLELPDLELSATVDAGPADSEPIDGSDADSIEEPDD